MAAPLCDSVLLNGYHPSLFSFSSKSNKIHSHNSPLGKPCPLSRSIASKWATNRRRRMPVKVKASLGSLIGGIFKGTDTGESTRQQYAPTVSAINKLEAEMSSLSDSQLRDQTSVLKERAQRGESLDSLLPVRLLIFIAFLFYLFIYFYNQLTDYLAGSFCCCPRGFKEGFGSSTL